MIGKVCMVVQGTEISRVPSFVTHYAKGGWVNVNRLLRLRVLTLECAAEREFAFRSTENSKLCHYPADKELNL
jgi:hypothetical protein